MELMLSTILAGERATNPSLTGFVTQLSPYEGLTCNVAEWLAGANLTTFLDASSKLTLDSASAQARATAVVARFRRWIERGLIPPTSLLFRETESGNAFMQGKAVFMRIWSRVGTLLRAQGVNFTWGVAPLPGETEDLVGASTFGAALLGINKYTGNVTRAALVADFLSGVESQRLFTTAFGLRPTIPELYQDPEVNRIYDSALLRSSRITNRPASFCNDQYLTVSDVIYSRVNQVLAGFADAKATIASINSAIADLLGIDHFGPPQNLPWYTIPSILVETIVAVLVVIILALAVLLVRCRDAASARRIPTEFLVGVLVGSLLGSLVPLTYVGTPNLLTCQMRVVLLGFGFTITASCMAAQDFRVYLIVSSPLRRVAADVNRILWQSLITVWVLEAALVGLWLGLDPLAPVDVKVDHTWRYTSCASSNATFGIGMFSAQSLLCCCLIGTCIWLAVRNRGVSPKANTSGEAMSLASYLIAVGAGGTLIILCLLNPGPLPQMLIMASAVAFVVLSILWAYLVVQLRAPHTVEDSSWMGTTIHASSSALSAGLDSSTGELPAHGARPAIHATTLSVRFARSERALHLSPWAPGVAVAHMSEAHILVVRLPPQGLVLSLRKLASVSPCCTVSLSFTATFAAGLLEVYTRSESDLKEWHDRLAHAAAASQPTATVSPNLGGQNGTPAAARGGVPTADTLANLTMSMQVATPFEQPPTRARSLSG
ncbi:hypothetical protein AMAG_09479 [Allomyces macrogynus ATCC 38327]|uniref:G-protein coupled receptors family 3 profile domain-containing protein n=1 Tax=Allomyces macrogynus (strain ATCC 38327) TaxID=578462 RepID=A0A0L0SPN4_ALLM3|nr:hypothetical protein, variant [Allomyces macrogynus ATCC 38327]KNE64459.1 hypothetical protein AMAG_09479 [Allomyces macrogynus ATCC 38327]|eukprot:KNE64458.1 hypothetical protein, variant [Allomyces macrogynus ATCC 38327]